MEITCYASSSTSSCGPACSPPPDEYELTTLTLNAYFKPCTNTDYDVFLYRQEKQATSYVRLRRQAEKCEFHDLERELRSQIIQGCASNELREKAMEAKLTLQQILDKGRAKERNKRQAREMGGTQPITTTGEVHKVKPDNQMGSTTGATSGKFTTQIWS